MQTPSKRQPFTAQTAAGCMFPSRGVAQERNRNSTTTHLRCRMLVLMGEPTDCLLICLGVNKQRFAASRIEPYVVIQAHSEGRKAARPREPGCLGPYPLRYDESEGSTVCLQTEMIRHKNMYAQQQNGVSEGNADVDPAPLFPCLSYSHAGKQRCSRIRDLAVNRLGLKGRNLPPEGNSS